LGLTLYFLRHGQTTCSRDNVFCGWLDPELTAEGVEMAEAFTEAYRSIPWRAVFSSPMRRTVATAQPLCDALGLRMELRTGLKELSYGKWEGHSVEKVDSDYHDDYIRWLADPAWFPPTSGELAVAVANRALTVIEEIKQRHPHGNVLIVSHKATIRIILCNLLGIDVGRFRYRLEMPVGSISVIRFDTQGPLLRMSSDRSHLDEHLRSLPGT
jgi:broad specificity phosphatase PhoE